ncbi:MAG: DUF4332 domain-containing protein [Chloroflexi bacterium]|nr:DUF4332 domain-containing protein [Chloroflexota bacterium]
MEELQKIRGIGPKTAQVLAEAGIETLADLAQSEPEVLAEIVQAPEWRRPNYEDWIQQAQALTQDKHQAVPQAELQALVAELNELAAELQAKVPSYTPPDFSLQGLKSLLKSNLDRFTPEMRLGAIKDLQEMLESTPPEEFLNPETWKGMWFTLNYLIQQEAGEVRDGLSARLSHVPGLSTLADLKETLADTPPEEFLKLDTWKGMWFILNYEMQNQAQSLKRRLLGDEKQD